MLIREIDPTELEQLAADAILRGYGELFAKAVAKAFEARNLSHLLYEPLDNLIGPFTLPDVGARDDD